MAGSITDVPGLLVGHVSDKDNRTGCTVILTDKGAVAGVDVRGAAPGTRETDLLRPGNLVEKVHAIALCGGSAYGLEAASGVMEYCEERGIGLPVGVGIVPIVPAAVLFDLACGSPSVRPDKAMGYAACTAADSEPAWGRVGAGTGATVGKVAGRAFSMPGGIGTASITLPNGCTVAAVAAVNALGDVVDEAGRILAGARTEDGAFLNCQRLMLSGAGSAALPGTNTTLGVVATTAKLDKAQANRLASVAHDGYARAIRPVHTQSDGDTIFALSYGQDEADFTCLCAAAAEVMAAAIRSAVTEGDRT